MCHDRAQVRRLHHAHAHQSEAMYRSMARLPDNPAGVVIEQFGPTRTFIAAGERLENRAIFTGVETAEQIDAVLAHFDRYRANCVIEVNPANFYVNPPAVWERRLLPALLSRGCAIRDFRCVWSVTEPPRDNPLEMFHWRRFGPDEIDQFIALSRRIEPKRVWSDADRAAQTAEGIFQYVGFADQTPAALGTLLVGSRGGYLQWWYTDPTFRRRGLQREGIRRRMRDAFDMGCECVFTVADFNTFSAANLQRCGLTLAYNYLLLRREARTVTAPADPGPPPPCR
jgi:RimJ/RimL family protein N-acetyltransferase